jgi:hypothetical protein
VAGFTHSINPRTIAYVLQGPPEKPVASGRRYFADQSHLVSVDPETSRRALFETDRPNLLLSDRPGHFQRLAKRRTMTEYHLP